MTRIERIFADWISANPPNPRHPRSIPSFIRTQPERLPLRFLCISAPLRQSGWLAKQSLRPSRVRSPPFFPRGRRPQPCKLREVAPAGNPGDPCRISSSPPSTLRLCTLSAMPCGACFRVVCVFCGWVGGKDHGTHGTESATLCTVTT